MALAEAKPFEAGARKTSLDGPRTPTSYPHAPAAPKAHSAAHEPATGVTGDRVPQPRLATRRGYLLVNRSATATRNTDPMGKLRAPRGEKVARILQRKDRNTDPVGKEYRPCGETRGALRPDRATWVSISRHLRHAIPRYFQGKIELGASPLPPVVYGETLPTPWGKNTDPAGKPYRPRGERIPTLRGSLTDPVGKEYRSRRGTLPTLWGNCFDKYPANSSHSWRWIGFHVVYVYV